MNGLRAERTQADDKQEQYSNAGSLALDEEIHREPDTARQEYKDDADINKLLSKYGVNALQPKQPIFGDTDYDLDLLQAFSAIDGAREGHANLPDHVRAAFPDLVTFLNAMADGSLARYLANRKEKENVPPPEDPPKTG